MCVGERVGRAGRAHTEATAMLRHYRALEQHTAACERCIAREQWLAVRFGPLPPPPQTRLQRLAGPKLRWVYERPLWVRASLLGALGGVMLAGIRMLFVLVTRRPSVALYLSVAKALAIAAWMGAAGGLVYSAVRAPLRRLRRAGDYLTGVAVVAGAFLALAIPGALFFGAFHERSAWVAGCVVTVLCGLFVGLAASV